MLAHQTPQNQNHCSAHAFGAKQGAPSGTRTPPGHSTSPTKSHTTHPHLATLSLTPQLAGPCPRAAARGPGGGKSRAHLSVGLSPIFPGTSFLVFFFVFFQNPSHEKVQAASPAKAGTKAAPGCWGGGTAAPFLRPRSRRGAARCGARHKGNGAAEPSQNNPTCPSPGPLQPTLSCGILQPRAQSTE